MDKSVKIRSGASRSGTMKKSFCSFLFASLLFLVLSSQAALVYQSDDDSSVERESIEEGLVSTYEPVIHDYFNEYMIAYNARDKARINHLFLTRQKEFVSSGVWDELIKVDGSAVVIRVLKKYFVEEEIRKETFRKAIEQGANNIVSYMLEEFKDIVKPESAIEQAELVKLACDSGHYFIVGIFAHNDFDCNLVSPTNPGRSYMHDLVISGEKMPIYFFLESKTLDLNRVDELGNTPLHYVTDAKLYKAMLFRKADPFIENLEGVNTILFNDRDLSMRYKILQFYIGYLIKYGNDFELSFVIDRKRVLEDSYHFISTEPSFYDIKYDFDIDFKGEHGEDAGGLMNEWFSLLIERCFVPRLENEEDTEVDFESLSALLLASAPESSSSRSEAVKTVAIDIDSSDSSSDSSSSNSSNSPSGMAIYPAQDLEVFYGALFEFVDSANKQYRISLEFTGPVEAYKMIGAIMARALLNYVPLKVKLVPSLVKLLYGETLVFEDLKDDDPVMYRSLAQLLEPEFDIKSSGYTLLSDENVMVTADNVDLFLNEKAIEVMYTRYKAQLDFLIEGFHSILSRDTLKSFFKSHSELDSVLSGVLVIDRADLYTSIDFKGAYWRENREMFYAGMDLLTDEELFEFVRFVTGINGIPYGGMSSLRDRIYLYDQRSDLFIRSATCSSMLKLPTTIKTHEELANILRFAFASNPEFFDY